MTLSQLADATAREKDLRWQLSRKDEVVGLFSDGAGFFCEWHNCAPSLAATRRACGLTVAFCTYT